MITRTSNGFMPQMELKAATPSKINTILVALGPTEPAAVQAKADALAAKFKDFAKMVLIFTPHAFTDGIGYRWVQCEQETPTLEAVLRSYTIRIPGAQIFGLCNADIDLEGTAEALMGRVDDMRIEMAWGAWAGSQSGDPFNPPEMFIMHAAHIPYLLQGIERKMAYAGDPWKYWLNTWLVSFLRVQRYIDATTLVKIGRQAEFDPYINEPEPAVQMTSKRKPSVIKKARKAP